jgi:NAD(P)-dependent dehydrogenase (short-subunit alcohol dehydrogenase family)
MSLNGRVALVTGAGRGIGEAVARRLAREGASVVVNDLGVEVDGSGGDNSLAGSVAKSIVAEGGKAVGHSSDIADYEATGELLKAVLDAYGQLDILVNAAGILRDRMIFNLSEDDWDAVVRVHLKGTFNTTRHAAAYWRDVRDASAHHRLINFTSASGLNGNPGQPNYAAAKMGIVGLTYSAANSLGRYGVTANAIAPVAFTRMVGTVPDQKLVGDASLGSTDPRTAENVAPVVAYLASTASFWCTGRVIGSEGFKVQLFSNPQVVREIVGSEPWEVDALGALMESTFKPVPRGVEGRYDHVVKA